MVNVENRKFKDRVPGVSAEDRRYAIRKICGYANPSPSSETTLVSIYWAEMLSRVVATRPSVAEEKQGVGEEKRSETGGLSQTERILGDSIFGQRRAAESGPRPFLVSNSKWFTFSNFKIKIFFLFHSRHKYERVFISRNKVETNDRPPANAVMGESISIVQLLPRKLETLGLDGNPIDPLHLSL
jgi:hypothetical protein